MYRSKIDNIAQCISIEFIAFPDFTGTNADSWNPRTKPKGHHISLNISVNFPKITYVNSYFVIFWFVAAEEPHTSGKRWTIKKSTKDSSRKCGALQEGYKDINKVHLLGITYI